MLEQKTVLPMALGVVGDAKISRGMRICLSFGKEEEKLNFDFYHHSYHYRHHHYDYSKRMTWECTSNAEGQRILRNRLQWAIVIV